METTHIIILAIALGIIVSGILLLKQSAKKFKLTDEQLKKIKERNEALEKEDQD
ncbi:DUF2897 family protein [Thalassotalea euphylliae]|uniref:DUF2897 family protein n=1 Tax=Thalassotalea euphylliae TaxID=1655234 RepID=UPI003635FF25